MNKYLLAILILILNVTMALTQTRPDGIAMNYTSFNKPLRIVLKELSSISKVNLVYSESRIPADKIVNISATNETLGSILTVILDDFDMGYQIVGNQIVLVLGQSDKKNKTSHTIYGHVRDSVSGEMLIGANIFLYDKSIGTSSNESGFYSIKLPQATHRIHFSYLGYKSEIIEFFVDKDTIINIRLQPDGLLNEIVLMDDLLEEEHENTSSQQNLHIDKILSSNHLVGEADLFRFISIQPGVSTGADGIGGLNVRGGSADQNLVLLDGVPVYNTGHALGIFSIFNSNTIKSASFYKGGIPARYAGRLSSVIDVHTKDGNYNRIAGDITLSTIALKATIEGPIIKDKSSFIVSFRRTFMDIWIKQFTKFQNTDKDRKGFANYYFSDLNAKVNFSLGSKTKLLLSVFTSNDDYANNTVAGVNATLRDENDQALKWGNQVYSARLNTQLSKSFFSKFTLYTTGYKFDSYRNNLFESQIDSSILFNASLFSSNLSELGIRNDFDWLPTPNNTVKFGIAYFKRSFQPHVVDINQNDFVPAIDNVDITLLKEYSDPEVIKGNELNTYIENDFNLGDGIRINAGVNYAVIYTDDNKNYKSLQPRFALLANGDNVHFKLGATRMQQYLHLLTNNGLGLPNDVWIPTSSVLGPQKSWIYNTSFGYRMNNGFKLGSEVYYKVFDNISSFKEGSGLGINESVDWQSLVPVGKGVAYGIEAYVEKVVGNTLFSTNYTYSISDREYADLNLGRKYNFGLNRRHSVKVSFTHRLSQFSEFLMNWSILSGNYYSQPTNLTVEIGGAPVVIFPEKNNAQFKAYHRLDVGFSFYNNFKWGRAKFFLGLYNAYNRNNPFYNELVRNNQKNGVYEFRQYSLLPFLPTLSYSLAF